MSLKSSLIVGSFKEAFPQETGLYGPEKIDFSKFYEKLVIAPRFSLENNPAVRHLISYCPILRNNRNTGDLEVLLYQRPDKKSGNQGEDRLAGDYSIGFGGHFEFHELSRMIEAVKTSEEGGALVGEAFIQSTARELDEEIKTVDEPVSFQHLVVGSPEVSRMIIDNSNNVGLHHVGLSTFFRVIDGVDFEAGVDEETSIKIVGWFTPQQINNEYFDRLESWSKMLNNYLVVETGILKEKYATEDASGAV